MDKIYKISRRILELEIGKKDYSIVLSKARDNIKTLELDIHILNDAFWKAKESGL